jgi:outer membrane lipoprotein-sorting protein
MKIIEKLMLISGTILVLPFLTGCAAGSATAGYSLKAKEADYLSASGEQRITERVKREVILELGNKDNPYIQPGY